MSVIDQATQAQLQNMQKRTGKTWEQLEAAVRDCGLEKHGEIVAYLKKELGMGHGDANTLVHTVKRAAAPAPLSADPLDEIYTGAKAALRPIHAALLQRIAAFGEFEIAPKKGYVSLRRKKQFAMVGPGTNTRIDVGLNLKDAPAQGRLEQLPPKGMCSHRVKLTSEAGIDEELVAWLREAFNAAG